MNDQQSTGYLENQFLIAMPQMIDPFFSSTVTYMWKHNEEGALGIVINKPLSASVADIFQELSIEYKQNETNFDSMRVLAGGPVEKDKGFIIHDAGDSWESSITITPEISICTSKTILEDIASGKGPENYLVALGCAGWEAGQLEKEITDNAWLTTPANSELIFSREYESKTNKAAAILGIDLEQISPAAGHS
ncbi:MAG: YqgE/AlgH family protein [Gammaproteobacteria bacterium]|jgi:putative transcriptional regulator|nr:YqgE/AlgH family protein [Gammaproteobacteria bacterium]MBT3858604.1 YqgE/AlgH family protein [Gammaproteobacteria bacterium]MBT3986658.1 YqgE/AlgH family protein [Gammaproteobacteria bacterium]MBT4255705.1 YqgE/AlgH family protein [Gammaproteobacteria bacterium]MBT4582754.1 YqgE/AlgH family protein [Gammaproteobacteria bacterium]